MIKAFPFQVSSNYIFNEIMEPGDAIDGSVSIPLSSLGGLNDPTRSGSDLNSIKSPPNYKYKMTTLLII